MYGAQSGLTALSGTHYTNFRILARAAFFKAAHLRLTYADRFCNLRLCLPVKEAKL